MTIPARALGCTGAEVSIRGYGAMELRGRSAMGGPEITDAEAGRLLNAGFYLIDTSVDYGQSEELIGRFLSSRRDEFFLASKCGCPLSLPPGMLPMLDTHDYSPASVRAGVEQGVAVT